MFLNIPRLEADVLLTPRLTLKLEDHSLSAVPNILFNKFAATIHIGGWGGGALLNRQTEDAPCRGDRDPLNTEYYINKSHIHHHMRWFDCQ